MKLKMLSINKELLDFTIADCPVALTKDIVILAGRHESSLCINDLILRESDSGILEYSYVFDKDNKMIGYVIYKNGFKLINHKTFEISELQEGYTYMVNTCVPIIKTVQPYVDILQFKSKEHEFTYREILAILPGDRLVIHRRAGKVIIDINEVVVKE